MKISFEKFEGKNKFACQRTDGSYTYEFISDEQLHHDLAHFVVETELELKEGFYGNIEKGYTIQQLSDAELIRTLGQEAWIAEVVTRNLQGLLTGGSRREQFLELIEWEFSNMKIQGPAVTLEQVSVMQQNFTDLWTQWNNISPNESIEVIFNF